VRHVGNYTLAWDVVNEAIDDSPDPKKIVKESPWTKVDDYVCKAFKAARAADPTIQLFYNDYKHASMTGPTKVKSDKVFNYIKELKARGCPIDGVGFQSHFDLSFGDDFEGLRANMKRYAEIGVKVHITEMDVSCNLTGIHKG